ncbi:uncharacterized protein LOC118195066 [Stegodyphus dumicola]|uniref:uncharacterized protein LOC118195066 n=1 Tax=Stegodyphus dumicola TaxID=202533 RepID=UPI0015AE9409|nr:uncharacterized protein LOC118195066 [Stegodyphus dumicola]
MTCKLPHHTVLHFDRNIKTSENEKPKQTSSLSPRAEVFLPKNEVVTNATTCTGQFSYSKGEAKRVLLCTALIKVSDSNGKAIPCRALLDCGSEASFISEECVSKLKLGRFNKKIEVSCLGSFNTVTSGEVELIFTPHFESNSKFRTYAFVIPRITSDVPNVSLPSKIANHFDDLVLADPKFYERKPIDILLGVNVFFTMLKGDIIKRGESLPFAICSQLGWIISGNTITDDSNLTNTFTVNNLQLNTNELVERFWSLDSIPEVKRISSEDKKCEEFFKTTHFRDQNGRYVVKLPFKDNPSRLGNSKDLALQRFKSLERNLLRSPDTYDMYKHFMKEYLDLGHMEPVRSSESPSQAYYMPHHAVIKESSSTSKIRVVFNATNDCLVGAQNTEECKNLVNQLLQMLERGGFLLRKWSSNDLSVLENIPQELRNDSEAMKIQDDSSIKVLGINWNPREDYFNFSVSISGEKV